MLRTLGLVALGLAVAEAFAPTLSALPRRSAVSSMRMSASTDVTTAGKINYLIELDSPKVATMMEIAPGDKQVLCRCWKSGIFPNCDGKHVEHNKATGDNVGPLIVSVKKED
mmetsp:Transcript_43091/g.67509  ORF Transcript_43091/g.67509 Transcript_43091/m.67509 type:complete len:112 (+) Transcript_43091:3-338(+)